MDYAIAHGLGVWNDESNAGSFTREGIFYQLDLPMWDWQCAAAGIDYSIAVIQNNGSVGSYWSRCRESTTSDPEFNKGTQAVWNAYRNNASGVPYNWAVGDITGSELDLVQNFVHEGGHTIGLGHPPQVGNPPTCESGGIMCGMTLGADYQRDLYSWEMKCADEIAGQRQASGFARSHSSGSFASPVTFTGSWDVSKGSVSSSRYTGAETFSAAFIRSDCLAWTHGLDTSNTKCLNTDTRNSIGPRAAVWRETVSKDRVFYPAWTETPAYSNTGKHRLSYYWSTNGFSTKYSGLLSYCSSMTGWMTCSSTTPVYTGKMVSVAWDDYLDVSHTAWVNQNRANNSASSEIFIASSFVNDLTLPVPEQTGLRTNVTPGLACETYGAGIYDCVLAYVPLADTVGTVKTRRFYSQIGVNNYTLKWDASEYTVNSSLGRTAHPIALWYESGSGNWWMAIRPTNHNDKHRLLAWSSSDGASWSYYGSLDHSIAGPTAVTTGLNGNNQLTGWN